MCGIAAIISGIRIDSSDSLTPQPLSFSINDLKAALERRGPDSLGTKKLVLHVHHHPNTLPDQEPHLSSFIQEEGGGETRDGCSVTVSSSAAEVLFIGATLQLRGISPVTQPFVDSVGSILVYNGEIYGGICIGSDDNDGDVLMRVLGECCSCASSEEHASGCSFSGRGKISMVDVLSGLKGPWAVVYWQNSSRTLWFGRDAFGRRSLLVHWPSAKDPRFLLSSVSPLPSVDQNSDFEVENPNCLDFWEELSCGIYSLSFNVSNQDFCVLGKIQKHGWGNPMLNDLVTWERASVEPSSDELFKQISLHSAASDARPLQSGPDITSFPLASQIVLSALRKSVMLRTSTHKFFQVVNSDRIEDLVPVAVLFSGGLDSMILAALLDECLDPRYGIDLLNVSFDGPSAPDRISAKAGVKELRRVTPLRRWRLVEIDSDLSKLTSEMRHVMSLIDPANTYMDLNIGIALWLAASGDGWISERNSDKNGENEHKVRYKSVARVVLVGSGADEQCAGYGRHRTKFRCGSWRSLHEEMKLDMQRIWKRNMGRDDRCIADVGKEARFPFLDEDVIRTLLDIPLWEIANLRQPSGTGDKKILREVAWMLGLHEAAVLPKRAIQFGSRIARESNKKNFGSNRAANQASAGSVAINMS